MDYPPYQNPEISPSGPNDLLDSEKNIINKLLSWLLEKTFKQSSFSYGLLDMYNSVS